MTTIVGVLNKRAVAIAADSAVTVGNTHKVMNTGNKIFALSKYAPVGIAIYGNSSLLDTPWEVIIKCYRKELKNKKYKHLKDYVGDFLQFLRNREFFSSRETQLRHLSFQMTSFLKICVNQAKKRSTFSTDQLGAIIEELNECKLVNKANADLFEDFKHYCFHDFLSFSKPVIESLLSSAPPLDVHQHFDLFAESFFYYMRVAHIVRNGESGLVFVGYGEEEIYPCLYNIITTIGFGRKLQFRTGEMPIEITNDGTTASIVPFAQIEATQTIIRGINPTFYSIISKNLASVLNTFKMKISTLLRTGRMDALASQVDALNISNLTDIFTTSAQDEFRKYYTNPLVDTVSHLGMADMANVADSLVSLTSLVHRMSPKEESVGGPVDVAVISKGDGFIWIKRKHYFDRDINPQFFNNYNND